MKSFENYQKAINLMENFCIYLNFNAKSTPKWKLTSKWRNISIDICWSTTKNRSLLEAPSEGSATNLLHRVLIEVSFQWKDGNILPAQAIGTG